MKKMLEVDVRFPMKSSAQDFSENIPMGFNPMNQTTTIGNISKLEFKKIPRQILQIKGSLKCSQLRHLMNTLQY
jgi:hypothetical protein